MVTAIFISIFVVSAFLLAMTSAFMAIRLSTSLYFGIFLVLSAQALDKDSARAFQPHLEYPETLLAQEQRSSQKTSPIVT